MQWTQILLNDDCYYTSPLTDGEPVTTPIIVAVCES